MHIENCACPACLIQQINNNDSVNQIIEQNESNNNQIYFYVLLALLAIVLISLVSFTVYKTVKNKKRSKLCNKKN
ncbi:hypothetical protein ACJA25_01795 [Mycoplasmopsis hyopharyngis]|uniref:hypothetical protein n=1 Tax=Mycoplasmopsis hyopharyngis TaxID=29558 RepID=UPI0038738B1C